MGDGLAVAFGVGWGAAELGEAVAFGVGRGAAELGEAVAFGVGRGVAKLGEPVAFGVGRGATWFGTAVARGVGRGVALVGTGTGTTAGATGLTVREGVTSAGVGDAGAVTGGGGTFLAPKMLGSPVSNTPAIQAIIVVASVPTNKAFQPSSVISLRREGIRAMVPPTKIPTEAK